MANAMSLRRCTPLSCAMVIAGATLFWILLRQVIPTNTSAADPAHQFVDPAHQFVDFRQISAQLLPKLNDSKQPGVVVDKHIVLNKTIPYLKKPVNESVKVEPAKVKVKAVVKAVVDPKNVKKASPQKKG